MERYSDMRMINELGDAFWMIEDVANELEKIRMILHNLQLNMVETSEGHKNE